MRMSRFCPDCHHTVRGTPCAVLEHLEHGPHEIAPVELPLQLPGASVGEGDGGKSSNSPTANRRNANRGARP